MVQPIAVSDRDFCAANTTYCMDCKYEKTDPFATLPMVDFHAAARLLALMPTGQNSAVVQRTAGLKK